MTVTIEYNPGQLFTGQTVTGTAYLKSNGNATGTSLTFNEDTNRPGFYRVVTGALTAGLNEITTSLGDVGYVNVVDGTIVTMDPSPLMASITIPATATLLTSNQASVVPSSGGPLALKSDVSISGSGSIVVSITVNDGTNPIQNARVTFTVNASVYSAITNSSGVATLSPNEGAATYGVAITAAGYQFTPTTLVVTGTMSHTYSMTLISITASSPPEVTGYLTCLDQLGNALAGVVHILTITGPPNGTTGISYSKTPRSAQSDSNGLVQFPGLPAISPFSIQRGPTGQSQTGNTGTTSPFALPSCAG